MIKCDVTVIAGTKVSIGLVFLDIRNVMFPLPMQVYRVKGSQLKSFKCYYEMKVLWNKTTFP